MEAASFSKMSVSTYHQQSITFQKKLLFNTAMTTSKLAKASSLTESAQTVRNKLAKLWCL